MKSVTNNMRCNLISAIILSSKLYAEKEVNSEKMLQGRNN